MKGRNVGKSSDKKASILGSIFSAFLKKSLLRLFRRQRGMQKAGKESRTQKSINRFIVMLTFCLG